MWKLRVPPRVKDLLWRAASNCLPTTTQLRTKHVSVSPMCPSCQTHRETITHCLVECSFARSCWDRTGISVDTVCVGSFADWLANKLSSYEDKNRKIIAMMCWALWKVRNELVWNSKGSSIGVVVALAYSSLDQWVRAQDKNVTPVAAFLTPEDGKEKWDKPRDDVIKINVDAAFFEEKGTYSYVCVARNVTGEVVEAISRCDSGQVAVEMGEAMGVREALSWMKGKQWGKVIIETDSLTVVQAIRSPLPMLSYFESVISDCKSMLVGLPNVSVLYIRRSANSVAHFLARASYYVADRTIRREDISSEFRDVILKDCQ